MYTDGGACGAISILKTSKPEKNIPIYKIAQTKLY